MSMRTRPEREGSYTSQAMDGVPSTMFSTVTVRSLWVREKMRRESFSHRTESSE